MKKLLLTITLLVFAVVSALAQAKFGIQAGLNLATVSQNPPDGFDKTAL